MIAAILEAWVDFPEEGLEFATMEELCSDLAKIRKAMQSLADTFHDGKILHEGLSLCLVGRPNVGKSSLMNALLDKDRAIVSSIAGTTRDILEDHMRLNGLHLKLIDTAGIRTTQEEIEKEGIRRSTAAMQQADLILLVLDSSEPFTEEDHSLLQTVPSAKTIAVWNKSDIPFTSLPKITLQHSVTVSAKEKTGLNHLKDKIDEVIWKNGPPSKEELIITNIRHKEALLSAIESCDKVISGLQQNVSPEFLTFDMRRSLNELGKIIGTNISEDILSAIFSTFCIGK